MVVLPILFLLCALYNQGCREDLQLGDAEQDLASRGREVREIKIQIHNIIVYNLVQAFVDMAPRRKGLL